MFFLMRSAVCIGLVAAAAPDPSGHAGPRWGADPAGVALRTVGHLCEGAPARCAALVEAAARQADLSGLAPLASLAGGADPAAPPALAGRAGAPAMAGRAEPPPLAIHAAHQRRASVDTLSAADRRLP